MAVGPTYEFLGNGGIGFGVAVGCDDQMVIGPLVSFKCLMMGDPGW